MLRSRARAFPVMCGLALLVSMQAKEPVKWTTATVLYAEYRLDSSPGLIQGGGTQTARGEFDFDAGDVVYTAREVVAPNTRLALSEGDSVQIAVDNKNLLLKISSTKVRKLKLAATQTKTKYSGVSPR